jgi:hypothetical protein
MTRPHRNESDRRIVVNGHEHIKDLIIRPDRVVGNRWRRDGRIGSYVTTLGRSGNSTTGHDDRGAPHRPSRASLRRLRPRPYRRRVTSRRSGSRGQVTPRGARAHRLDVGRHEDLDSATITR